MCRSSSRGHADRMHDALIRPAPANIALHRALDFDIRRVGRLVQQPGRRQDHAGSTVAALHGVGLDERGLEGMQPAIMFQAFDGGDLFSLREPRRRTARPDRSAVEQDGAGSAESFTAAVLGAG